MRRINITEWDEDDGQRVQRLIGWFDADRARRFVERREAYDGANLAGVHLRDQNRGQVLWLTASGRWIVQQWSRWQGEEEDTWRYVDEGDAYDWLMVNGDDDAVTELFGAPQPERGPGRPAIGPLVHIRLAPEMIAAIDEVAAVQAQVGGDEWRDMPRAELIRRLLMWALHGDASGYDPAQVWRERRESGRLGS